jgi:thiamine biosynthesis lipoprotein
MIEHDVVFDAMGSQVRLVIGAGDVDADAAASAADRERRFVADFEAALSRFEPDSELSALNADPRQVVPASEMMRAAVRAGVEAARLSGGLVDPTLLAEIESAGYVGDWDGSEVTLADAIASAPPRHPARRRGEALWERLEIDDDAGTITRPAGVGFDTGGIGKGLAADLIAGRLKGFPRFVVDCGGDVRIGGPDALVNPYEVLVEHPLTGEGVYALRLGWGGVATSGLNVRLWRGEDGRPRHHLLDPSSGEPAWTGLVGATALGDTAVEAEALAKAALLSGPAGGRAVLTERGGLLVHDDGTVEAVGPLSARRI